MDQGRETAWLQKGPLSQRYAACGRTMPAWGQALGPGHANRASFRSRIEDLATEYEFLEGEHQRLLTSFSVAPADGFQKGPASGAASARTESSFSSKARTKNKIPRHGEDVDELGSLCSSFRQKQPQSRLEKGDAAFDLVMEQDLPAEAVVGAVVPTPGLPTLPTSRNGDPTKLASDHLEPSAGYPSSFPVHAAYAGAKVSNAQVQEAPTRPNDPEFECQPGRPGPDMAQAVIDCSDSSSDIIRPSFRCKSFKLDGYQDTTIVGEVKQLSGKVLPSWLVPSVNSFVEWWNDIEEPTRSGLLAKVVTHVYFELACFFMIALQGYFAAQVTDYEIQEGTHDLPTHLLVADYFFLVWYVVELGLRLSVHKVYFLIGSRWRWNMFDLFLVIFAIVDYMTAGAVSLTFLRQFRILRVAKVLRAMRAMQVLGALSELRLMINCVINSLFTLLWCIVLILFIMYIFAMMITQAFADYLVEEGNHISAEERGRIMNAFGSVTKAGRSLLMSTTGGNDWATYYTIIEGTGQVWLEAIFIFYILFFVVAAWNIITGTFVNQAFKLAQPDVESIALEKFRRDQMDVQQFMSMFKAADKDKSGTISYGEFCEMVEGPLAPFLHSRGIEVKDAEAFYKIICESTEAEDGAVDVEAFVSGCLQMKGTASTIDLHASEFRTVRQIQRQMGRIQDMEETIEKKMEEIMCALPKHVPGAQAAQPMGDGPDILLC